MAEHTDKLQKSTDATPGYETEDVSMLSLHAIGIIISIFIIASLIVLNEYFTMAKEKEVYERALKPQSAELQKLRAYEDEILSSYSVIDEEKGIYQVPIDRAMELLVEEAAQ